MSISTRISNYSKPHNSGNGSGGGSTYVRGGVSNTDLPANFNVTSISAVSGNINTLTGVSLDYKDGNFIYLNAGNGKIVKLRGDELNYEHGKISDFHSDSIDNTGKITTNELEVTANAFIKDLTSNTIITDYLTVTKQAHFFELVIDKVRSVGGTLILTPAQCIADYVKAFAMVGNTPDPSQDTEIPLTDNVDVTTIDYYVIYWLAQDEGTTRKNTNDWIVDDQAYCTSFNVASGVNYDVSNKYYWRLVKAIFGDQYMNLNTGATLPLSQAADAAINSVYINTPTVYYKLGDDDVYVNTDWHTYAQVIGPTYEPGDTDPATGVEWIPVSGTGESGQITQGTMTTKNTIFGIQLQPRGDTILSKAVPEKFIFTCNDPDDPDDHRKARLNIGVYYSDNSSEWFPAPELAKSSYTVTLKAVWNDTKNAYVSGNTQNIETVVITNADDVEWKMVHSIALSNNRNECDVPQDHTGDVWFADKSSIPSIGDNITQLGYRYQNVSGYPSGGTAEQIADWISNNQAIYDRSSAQIISANKTPDTDVRPPAYAQYTGINDYSLRTHRGTWIDATGGYFKGNLVSSDGTIYDIDNNIINPDQYKIVPDYNVITVESGGTVDPSPMTVSFLSSKSTTLLTTVPTGCIFQYSINNGTATSVVAGQSVSIITAGMSVGDNLTMYLKQYSNNQIGILYDTVKMTVTEITSQPGTAGRSGSYTQYAYKNATSTPSAPASSDSTYPPSGWTETPTTPDFANGEYTWCTTRTIRFSSTNQPIYGAWSTPYRITGDNGQTGEDGNSVEFIYRRFKTEQTFGNNNLNPEYWATNQNPDYTGEAYSTSDSDSPNDKWTDNPRGVNSTYMYEYVASREFKFQTSGATTKTWGQFSPAAIWSKWGEKGQDGDGYEYIYARNDSTTVAPTISYNSYGGKTQYDDDFVPQGWSDDPQGVTSSTNEHCEWVAVRKKTNGDWGLFSTPALWAQYVPPGTQGQNGGYTQYAYKNTASTPSAPSTSTSTYPPSGWTISATTPDFANGEYTWCTTRNVTFSSSNQPIYGAWETPYRITGDNGMPGEDGDYTEFIYILKTQATTFTGQDNPANWTSSSSQDKYGHNYNDRDYVGPTSAGWDDNPTGIDSTNKFEYMSWRSYDGATNSFSSFSQPAIWSRFGENGRDGDGYEYIFKTFSQEQTSWPQNNTNPAYWSANQNDEYYGPTGYEWSDDPQPLDDTNNKFEYVSVRKKKYDSTQNAALWGQYSTPELWSMYGGTGPMGPQGPQGQSGPGSDYYSLVPLREIFEVQINAEQVGDRAYDNITGAIYTDVLYGVAHVSGNSVSYLTSNEIQSLFELQIISNPYGSSSGVVSQFAQTSYTTAKLNDNASSSTIGAVQFQSNNILADMWPNNSNYQNYYYLHSQGTSGISKAPVKLNVALVTKSNSNQIDHRTVSLVFKASHLFSVTDTALNSIYQGLSGTQGAYTQTGFSNIRQTWDNINLSVNNLKYANSGALEIDSDIEQFIYQRNNSSTEPQAPVSGTWETIPSGWVQRTSYHAPTQAQQYVWMSQRTRTVSIANDGSLSYGTPASWSDPILFDKYGVARKGTINSAQLDIEADRIESTVTSGVISTVSDAVMNGKTIEIDLTYDALNAAGLNLSSISGTKAGSDNTNNYKAEAVFIPVGINFNTTAGRRGEGWDIVIERNFDRNLGYPYYSIHNGGSPASNATIYSSGDGFEFAVAWHTVGSGWGTSWVSEGTIDSNGFYANEKNITSQSDPNYGLDTYRYILQNEFNWTQSRNYKYNGTTYGIPRDLICGSIRQDGFGSIELIYLRGGSKYRIHTDNFEATAQAYATGYNNNSRTMPVIYPNSIDDIIIPAIDTMKRSEIIQTANEISLSVYEGVQNDLKRTGIDITTGQIDLIADNTNIIGNLNLKNTDNGITLYDENGNARVNIIPQNTPTPTAGDNSFSSRNFITIGSNQITKTAYAQINVTTEKVDLGSFNSGQSIIMNICPRLYGLLDTVDYYMENNASTITCTAKLYLGSNSSPYSSTTQTLNRTIASNGMYEYPEFNWTVSNLSSSGTYKIEVTITATDSNPGYIKYKGSAYIDYEKQVQSLTYLGLDGLLIGSSNNHFAKISKDAFEFRWIGTTNNAYGGTAIRMSDNSFQRVYNFSPSNGPLSWVAFDGYSKSTVLSDGDFKQRYFYSGNDYIYKNSYIVQPNDVNIFIPQGFTLNEAWILLGDGVGGRESSQSINGRKIVMRNFSGKSVNVCIGSANAGYHIMWSDNGDYESNISLDNAGFTFMTIPTCQDSSKICNWALMHKG